MGIRRSCAVCAVRAEAMCATLQSEQLNRLNRIAYRRHYNAGQFIVGAGQRQEWFATLLSGVVKLTKTMPDGRHQIVGLLFASDFLGRPFLESSPYSVEAATAVELCCVERSYFEELMLNSPALKQQFLERTLNDVDAARDWMVLLGRKTAEEKAASLILMMARRGRTGNGEHPAHPMEVELPLSRTEMAEYLGVRIETISRQLGRLREAGVIETPSARTIAVRDMRGLARLAGGDAA